MHCTRILAYLPACTPQQRRDPTVAVASVLTGQADNGSGQPIFVVALDRLVPLRPAPLLQQAAAVSFRHPLLLARVPPGALRSKYAAGCCCDTGGGVVAKLIEFYVPSTSRKSGKWVPVKERGKVIEFVPEQKKTA
jgi:hypothetical protein